MKIKSRLLIILFLFIVAVYCYLDYCRDSYLLTKARLITIYSAVLNYKQDNSEFPCADNIEELLSGYLPVVPEEPGTKSNKMVESYDGTGGWVYDTDKHILQVNSIKIWNFYTWYNRLEIKFH